MQTVFMTGNLSRYFTTMQANQVVPAVRAFASKQSRRVSTRVSKVAQSNGSLYTPEEEAKNKKAAVEAAMEQINKKLGKGSIMLASDRPAATGFFSTGTLTLDVALGGGWPKGRIVEIYGPESSGKTALATAAIKEVQKSGGLACLIDAEHAFSTSFAQAHGVDIGRLLLSKPDHGEAAFETLQSLVGSRSIDLIVVDSVAALTPKAELEAEIGQPQMATHARLMSAQMRRLVGTLDASQTTVIFINQIRHKVGIMFGSPEVTTGGNALKYYCSARVDLRRIKKIPGKDKNSDIGIKIRAKVIKLKTAAPFKEAEFDLLFETGIDTAGSVLDAAERIGLIQRKGAWYYIGDEKLGQGRDNAIQTLSTDQERLRDIEAKTKQAIFDDNNPALDLLLQSDGKSDFPDIADLPPPTDETPPDLQDEEVRG